MGVDSIRIYLDSCTAIYLVEEHQGFAPKIESLLEASRDADIFISDLTVMECLVGPLRNKNHLLENKFHQWFANVTVLAITSSAFVKAAELRALYQSLRTPDAIHLAAALHSSCDEFWTNDNRLEKITPIVRNVS